MQSKKMGNLFSIGSAARHLGISRDTLRRWEKRGKIKPYRSPTNRRYYTKKLLDEVIEGVVESPQKAPKKSAKKGLHSLARLLLAAILSSIAAVLIATAIVFFLSK